MEQSNKESKCSSCGIDLIKMTDADFTELIMKTGLQGYPGPVDAAHVCDKCGKKFCWGCTSSQNVLWARCSHCGAGIKQDI
jgi:DNA-directed RNA polymerase subunit RPC12/RpoP